MKNYKRAETFLKNVSGEIGIFHHNDCDGVCSAALVLAYLKQNSMDAKIFCGGIDKATFEGFSRENFDAYIFLDFPVDQYVEWLKPFKGKKVLFIDHHPIHNDLNKVGFIHVNPRFEKPDIYISASRVIFEILKKIGLKNYEWLARLGDAGDYAIEGTEKEREASEIIAAIEAVKGHETLGKVAKVLADCKRLVDFLCNKKYREYAKKLKNELEKQIAEIELEGIKDVNFVEIRSRYKIISILATTLLEIYPNKTFVIYKKWKDVYSITGRSKKVNIGVLFKRASKDIGTGGGHEVAGGAEIEARYFEEFKKRIMNALNH